MDRRLGLIGLATALLLILTTWSRAAQQYTLAADGKTTWSIYLPANASAAESLAAKELASYLRQMTGVAFDVSSDRNAGRNHLVVAAADHVTSFGIPGNYVPPKSPGEYTIVAAANAIWISGQDGPATLHAVYQFLDAVGCRFLAPQFAHYNGSAEIIPNTPTLTFDESAILRHNVRPALRFRKLYVEEGHSHTAENLMQMAEWMPKVGYNTLVIPTNYQGHDRVKWDNWREALTPELQNRGILIEVGGHGYQNFLNAEMENGEVFKKHPEWFAQDAAGKRTKARAWVPCTSNPQAVEALTKNFLAYIKDRPEIQIFDFWPPDGAKWCECEKCRALGTPPDRQAILLAHVKKAVAAVRPDLRLEVIAYSSYVNPPEHEKVDPSVLVDFCPISQQFDYQINDPAGKTNAKYAEALQAWRKAFPGDISIYSYYRKYAWDSLPAVIPHYMQRDMAWYMTLPVQGISTYSEPGDWFTYELNHYTLAALGLDPGQDVDALVRKFATARYGSAADVAVAAYNVLEQTVPSHTSLPHTTRKSPEMLAAGEKRLKESREKVRGALAAAMEPGVKHNLGRLVLMHDYAIEDLAILQLIARKDPAARERAIALHKMVQSEADAGVFLIKNNRLNQARMLKRLGIDAGTPSASVPE